MKKLALSLTLAISTLFAAEPPPLPPMPPMPPEPPTPVIFLGVDFLLGTELPDGSIKFFVPGAPQITVQSATNFVELRASTNLTNWNRQAYLRSLPKVLIVDTTARELPMRFYTTKPAQMAANIVLEAESFTTATNHVIGNFDGAAYLAFTSWQTGQATYDFTVLQPGVYTGWARVKSDSGAQDSFFLRIDGVPSENGVEDDIFDTGQNETYPGTWETIKVVGRGGVDVPWGEGETGPRYWNFGLGTYTLVLRAREANTELDKIILTQDLENVPE